MSKKIRYRLETTRIRKSRDIETLNGFNAKQISIEKDKRNNIYILFSLKSEIDMMKFEKFVEDNNLKCELC